MIKNQWDSFNSNKPIDFHTKPQIRLGFFFFMIKQNMHNIKSDLMLIILFLTF